MWLLQVLQVYLHQMINLNMNILKVFQVSLQLFLESWLGIITYVKI